MKHSFTIGKYILILLLLSSCGSQSGTNTLPETVKELKVKLILTEPSYLDLFSRCEIIKLDSDPQALMSVISKVICVNDSIFILDLPRSNVFLFSPDGKFLNKVGTFGDGPEDYYLCYDFAIHPSSGTVSLINPMGEMIDYTKEGKYLRRRRLTGKPNYYACQWLNDSTTAIWSCMNIDEPAITISEVNNDKIKYEGWYENKDINFQRMNPFFECGDSVCFAAPLKNDVYIIEDSCMRLRYTWLFSPVNISEKYLDEIRNIEDSHDRNERLIYDYKNKKLRDIPSFNGETKNYYYVALQTGITEDATIKSVFYSKDNDSYVVFTRFKEGISFQPIFMNEEYMLCRIPYNEVKDYNNMLGSNIKCSEDENPLLAKFFFKK